MKSGRELLDHLKLTGTGVGRVQHLEDFLSENAEANGEACLTFMTDNRDVYLAGTIEKTARFLGLPVPGASITEETENLREQLEATKKDLADVQAKNAMLLRTNQALQQKIEAHTKQETPRRLAKADRQLIGATD